MQVLRPHPGARSPLGVQGSRGAGVWLQLEPESLDPWGGRAAQSAAPRAAASEGPQALVRNAESQVPPEDLRAGGPADPWAWGDRRPHVQQV